MSNMHGLFVNSWRLFSIFISAIMMISIISPSTAMAAEVLVAPVPIYPANLQEKNLISDSPLGIPSFEWSAVSEAITYRLQVDSEAGFNRPIALDLTTRNTSDTTQSGGHLFADGDMSWRVAMIDGNGRMGAYSNYATFEKLYPVTTLNNPMNKNVLDTPTLRWDPVDGATTYLFIVSRFTLFYPIHESMETINTEYTPP